MAKQTTKANGDNGNKSAGPDVAGSNLAERIADKLGEALEKFGKEKVETAITAATDALRGFAGEEKEISALQQQIENKKAGTAVYLHNLAKQCVTLTMKGNRAMLEDAAELMRSACWFAEDTFLMEDAKAHSGVLRKLSEALPSWPPLKGDTINAMQKAHLNPHKFEGPAKLRDGYRQWKEKNPAGKSERGAKPRAETAGVSTGQLPKRAVKVAENVEKLTDSARSALAALIAAIQSKPETVQNKAAGMVSALTMQVKNLKDDEAAKDAEAGIKTTSNRPPARPARESEHAPANA
jgi:hypothetical protein